MAFNEALQRAHFTYTQACGKHQGAAALHHALMATGVLTGEAYDLSQKLLKELYDARQEAMVALQVEQASAYRPKPVTPLSEGYQFQRAFGTVPANEQRLIQQRTA